MNYIDKQLLLSSAVKAIDFLGSAMAADTPSSSFNFAGEELSIAGMDPMQTLDLLYQHSAHKIERPQKMSLCMPEAVTPALATNWLMSSWNVRSRSQVVSNREVLADIKTATERWLRQLLPVDEQAGLNFFPDTLSANLRALVVARDMLLQEMNWDTTIRGMFNAPTISIVASSALSEQALSALSFAGFGRSNITFVPTRDDGTMDMDRLPVLHERSILYLQAMHPITGAIENGAIIQLAKRKGAWVHIDAPISLWMSQSSNKASLFSTYRLADSWVTDTSMWFECPEDLGILACRNSPNKQTSPLMTNMVRDSSLTTLWASLRSLGESGLQSRIARSTVYTEYVAHKLIDSPVEVGAAHQTCHVLISFEQELHARIAFNALTVANITDHSLVYWRGKMRVRIPLISWRQTPESVESIVAIIRQTVATDANLASAS